jgi:presenilin-like A22 family membrane protease
LKNRIFATNYINNGNGLRFNSAYIIFIVVIILFFILLNTLIKRTDYNILSVLASLIVCCITIVVYFSIVNLSIFRVSFSSFIGIATFCEILKHRNNYPTLKNPQYTIVQDYLNFDFDNSYLEKHAKN